jgi:hypothetical protein
MNKWILATTFIIFLGGAYMILSVPKCRSREGFISKNGPINVATPPYPNPSVTPQTVRLDDLLETNYYKNSKENPFGNILLTEIQDTPLRKPAPPSFNLDTEQKITQLVKQSVQELHPNLRNTNKELYGDLWDNFELDQANRRFYSTAITTIPNDQASFSTWLYGASPSCRDVSKGNTGDFACVQDNLRYLLI